MKEIYLDKDNYPIVSACDRDASREEKQAVIDQICKEFNLSKGMYLNRHNDAGDSYNKVIGFLVKWNNCSYCVQFFIICDRAKKYTPEYCKDYSHKFQFIHGEIWGLPELEYWRQQGWMNNSEEEFNTIWAQRDKVINTCFLNEML